MAWRGKTRPGPPSQACRPGMPSLGSCRHYLLNFLGMLQISSGQRGRHYLNNFLEMRRKTCRKKFRNGPQKKVPESAGLVGGSGLSFGPDLIFKSGPNHQKWPEMGPEWSPGPENRSPGMPRPFSRLWDRSRGPKPPKYSPNSRSTAPGGR